MSSHQKQCLLIALILFLALILRIIPLTYSHFWDETVFLQHARVMLDGRANYEEFIHRPPLLSALYAVGFALWDNIYVANLVQGVVTTLAVLFAFLYIRQVWTPVAALFGAFLLAFTPYFVKASHDLLTDMPALTFMFASMWLFAKPDAWSALLAGVVFALAIQTRFTSLFLVIYFALDAASRERRQSLLYMSAGAAAAIAPYLLWVRWRYGSFFYSFALARRIVTEWTAPVPSSFYARALLEIFPVSLWLFFAVGILLSLVPWNMLPGKSGLPGSSPLLLQLHAQARRQIVLLLWGLAFFFYMLRIPHKEVRYLLPLAIPVVVISSLGLAALYDWFRHQAVKIRAVGLLLGAAVIMLQYAAPLHKLWGPWMDASLSEEVQIAQYIRNVSSEGDTVYAAHIFPVLAFYSERRTESLLPFQENFYQEWSDVMRQPGFLVYFHPDKITEIHAINPSLKPDRQFLAATPNFSLLKVFPSATVYRYMPKPGLSEK